MKLRLLLAAVLVAALPVCLLAQAPQLVNYQAVARGAGGGILANQNIKVRLSVKNNSATGTTVYEETHASVTTNQFGLFTVAIGGGTPNSGTLSAIDWASGAKFLKVEVDFNNSGTYSDMGTSQLLSVPYALHAKTVENDNDDQTLSISGTTLSISGGNTVTLPAGGSADNWGTQTVITGSALTGAGTTPSPLNIAQQGAITGQVLKWNGNAWAPAPDTNTDNQSLNLNGSTLSITGGNSVTLPSGGGSDNWGTQTASTNATLTGNGTSASPLGIAQQGATSGQVLKWNGTAWAPSNDVGGGAGDNWGTQSAVTGATLTGTGITGSPLNIAQQGATSGQVLKWNGTTWAPAADTDTNTDAQTLTLNGTTLGISGGNTVTLPTGTTYTAGSGITIAGNAISATDNSTSNEIQTLTLTGSNLSLSNGGGSVTLPAGTSYSPGTGIGISGGVITNTGDVSTTNELQSLSLSGNTLSISNGNSVTLPSSTDAQTLSLSGSTLSISNGNSVSLPTGTTYTAGTGISISGNVITNTGDADNNTTNEIQTLTLSGNNLTLSNGGGTVALPSGGSTYTGGTGITISGTTINSLWTASGNNIYNNNTGNVGIGNTSPSYPLHGLGNNTTSAGVFSNSNAAGIGFSAQNTAAAGSGLGNGLFGATQQSNGFGVYGANLNTNGTGVLGVGNNLPSYVLPTGGAGGAFYGSLTGGYGFSAGVEGYGLYGKATNTTSAYGVVGIANGNLGSGPLEGAGGAFTGNSYGVSGTQTGIIGQTAGGYFVSGYDGVTSDATTLVEAFSAGGVHYKIWGSPAGLVSTTVPDLDGNLVTLHAPETPEAYFQDYGQGQLVNGKAHIDLDPILAKNVAINDKHPLRVFVQLEGDCNGVYVTNKTSTGFDVIELGGGQSNVPFQWSVTCNMADYTFPSGRVSRLSDLRFEPGPDVNLKNMSGEKK